MLVLMTESSTAMSAGRWEARGRGRDRMRMTCRQRWETWVKEGKSAKCGCAGVHDSVLTVHRGRMLAEKGKRRWVTAASTPCRHPVEAKGREDESGLLTRTEAPEPSAASPSRPLRHAQPRRLGNLTVPVQVMDKRGLSIDDSMRMISLELLSKGWTGCWFPLWTNEKPTSPRLCLWQPGELGAVDESAQLWAQIGKT